MNKLSEFKRLLPIVFPDYDYLIPLTQAMLESGRKLESKLAQEANNFWGIKAGDKWVGDKINLPTTEVVNGEVIHIDDLFRRYPRVQVGMENYAYLIKKYHPKTYLNRNFYKGYFTNIASWATDPDYTKKLINLYEELKSDITEREQWSTSS